jgi:hypothetical protein
MLSYVTLCFRRLKKKSKEMNEFWEMERPVLWKKSSMRNKMERPVLQGIKFCEKMFCHNPALSGGYA